MKTKSILDIQGMLKTADRNPNAEMIDAFENQFCACWDDPAMQAERRVWAMAWSAASAAMAGPEPCDMGPPCIGCTPRVGGVPWLAADKRGLGMNYELPPLPASELGSVQLASGMHQQLGQSDESMRAYALAVARDVMRLSAQVEREACAQIVSDNASGCREGSELRFILESNAAAIRARG